MQHNARAILIVGALLVTLVTYISMKLVVERNPAFEMAISSPHYNHKQRQIQQQRSKSPVAFVISVSSCADKRGEPSVVDGSAVLGWSIRKHSQKYGYHLYAFVHNDTTTTTTAEGCVEDLRTVGYDVRVVDMPFRLTELQDDLSRFIEDQSSCCGAKEFLKLYAYTLSDHQLVVHLDVDTLLLQPMDDLLDYLLIDADNVSIPIISTNSNSQSTITDSSFSRKTGNQLDFLFTPEYTTPNLIEPFNKSKYGVQEAFFIVRPNMTWIHEMLAHLKRANYQPATGWGLAGYGGYWGCSQVQGFLSWVYPEHYYDPSRIAELNPCIYNTLAMDFSRFSDSHCQKSPQLCGKCRTVHCLDCKATPLAEIKIVHFSTCFKPWKCPRHLHPTRSLCKHLHPIWYRYRMELELAMGVVAQQPPKTAQSWNYGKTFGYCHKTGEFRNTYVILNVTKAQQKLLPFPTRYAAFSLDS